jgi:hypothetical protein
MTIVKGSFKLLDVSTGAIKSGMTAFQAIENEIIAAKKSKGKKKAPLVSLFIEVAENKATKQKVVDAQYKTVMTGHAGKIPDFVYDTKAKKYKDNWSDESVKLAAHLAHWLPNGSWGYARNESLYKDCKGSTLKVLIAYCLGQAKAKSAVLKQGSGSYFWRNDWPPTSGGHLEKFAGGAGLREIKKVCPNPVSVNWTIISTDKYYKDHIFMASENGKGYYVIPIDGTKFKPKPKPKKKQPAKKN